ncbi:Bug family tripartite tricarboxylate transporter substrate binding protein [Ottowia thiooxydans]|uniref:Bug family tripartite tricarboxylate transporter substrate binding protein n=1 Tax=Ottowia thiooxydans TaxID=219182 RepID=UPI0004291E98|nr:tripartite tricarboxylate transporter substrate-binding protein [Ottowia thiooxydans]
MPHLNRRAFAALAASALSSPALLAQPKWPVKPPKLVVGFAAGGGSDFVARALAQEIGGPLGQSLIIENRPGAGGIIAAQQAASAEPDGYTLLLGSAATFVINPVLMPNLPYDPQKDFVPVGGVARFAYLLLGRPGLETKTVQELIAFARQNPGKLTIGSAGNGSNTHLAAAAFQRAAGIQLRHIPYKGTNPALTDLRSGTIDLLFDSVPTVLGQVRAGALQALASSGKSREPLFPEIPTIAESGVPSFSASNWFAVFAPARTPPAVVATLNAAIQRALGSDKLKNQFASTGNIALPGSSTDLAQLVDEERNAYARLIKESGIRLD